MIYFVMSEVIRGQKICRTGSMTLEGQQAKFPARWIIWHLPRNDLHLQQDVTPGVLRPNLHVKFTDLVPSLHDLLVSFPQQRPAKSANHLEGRGGRERVVNSPVLPEIQIAIIDVFQDGPHRYLRPHVAFDRQDFLVLEDVQSASRPNSRSEHEHESVGVLELADVQGFSLGLAEIAPAADRLVGAFRKGEGRPKRVDQGCDAVVVDVDELHHFVD